MRSGRRLRGRLSACAPLRSGCAAPAASSEPLACRSAGSGPRGRRRAVGAPWSWEEAPGARPQPRDAQGHAADGSCRGFALTPATWTLSPSSPAGSSAVTHEAWKEKTFRAMGRRLPIQLLTWDVKDTLLRFRHPVGEEYAAKARARGLEVEAAALGQAFTQAYRTQSHSFPNYGLSQGLTSRRWWLDVVLQTFYLAGVRDAQAVATIADQLYEDFSKPCTWQLLEGAEATLRGCRKRGLRLAVVSNFDRRLEDILTGLGLREHFDFVLTSEAAGWPKPDPRIFHEALRLAQVEPAGAAHIGDSYLCDYKGAQDVGMHSFLLFGPEPLDSAIKCSVPQERLLPSLSHLLPALDRLEGSALEL